MQKQDYSSKTEGLAQRIADTSVGPHLQRKIKYGDPDTGWEGDPFLVLTYEDGYWSIWDTHVNPPDLVARKKADGSELNTRALTEGLRDSSLRRQSARDIFARIERHNDAVEAAAEKARRTLVEETSAEAAPLVRTIIDQV
jgi:hypothetical protein